MIPITEYAGRDVAVYGLGRTGLSAAKALAAGGARVHAWDDGDAARLNAEAEGVNVSDINKRDWQKFAGYCQKLARLSQVRAYGVDLNGEQIDFLNSIDQRFGELTGAGDRPIVIDVHSDPNNEQVVQQAVGQPKIVVIDDLRGARMSFHQFKHPMRSRMTDQEWQRSLESQ